VARDLTRRGHHVVAVDVSAVLVRHAAESSTGETYILAAAAALPFAVAGFDLVVAYSSLMDIDGMSDALREVSRVLRPGGRLCICVTHPINDAGGFVDVTPMHRSSVAARTSAGKDSRRPTSGRA